MRCLPRIRRPRGAYSVLQCMHPHNIQHRSAGDLRARRAAGGPRQARRRRLRLGARARPRGRDPLDGAPPCRLTPTPTPTPTPTLTLTLILILTLILTRTRRASSTARPTARLLWMTCRSTRRCSRTRQPRRLSPSYSGHRARAKVWSVCVTMCLQIALPKTCFVRAFRSRCPKPCSSRDTGLNIYFKH